jgi:hypothetical protein
MHKPKQNKLVDKHKAKSESGHLNIEHDFPVAKLFTTVFTGMHC